MMTKMAKIVFTVVTIIIATLLIGVVREISPSSGWLRIVISVCAFAVLLWLWMEGAASMGEKADGNPK